MPDYDSALSFFRAIGFEVTADEPQNQKRWVTVTPAGGGAALVLAQAANDAQKAMIGHQGAGRVWLFLHSTNFAQDSRRIIEAGGHFEESPRRESYGTVAVWRDPWGNRWDLIAPHA